MVVAINDNCVPPFIFIPLFFSPPPTILCFVIFCMYVYTQLQLPPPPPSSSPSSPPSPYLSSPIPPFHSPSLPSLLPPLFSPLHSQTLSWYSRCGGMVLVKGTRTEVEYWNSVDAAPPPPLFIPRLPTQGGMEPWGGCRGVVRISSDMAK